MSDHDETPETDRAVCPICGGQADPDCEDCFGTGKELTRDEIAALADDDGPIYPAQPATTSPSYRAAMIDAGRGHLLP